MIDQASTLAILNNYVERLDTAVAAFYAGVSQTPVGYSFNNDQWLNIIEVVRQWQEALDSCIQIGLSDTINGFFYDRRYAENVTEKVNLHLRSVVNVLSLRNELGVRYKFTRLEAPALNFWTVFPYLSNFGDVRSRKYIGKLAGYLPAALLQLYKDDMSNRRRGAGLWLFGFSALTVATTFVLSKILGEQSKPALAVVCALGLGAASVGLLGMATAKLSSLRGAVIKMGGGIAMAAFFLVYPPIVEGKFEVRFVLRRPDTSPIVTQLVPGLTVGGQSHYTFHPHDSIYYEFSSIQAHNKNLTANLHLGNECKWMFPGGKKDSLFTLSDGDLQTYSVMLERDPATLMVHGKLPVAVPTRFDVTNFPSLAGRTDPLGNFSFRLPDSFEGNEVQVYYLNEQRRREARMVQVDKIDTSTLSARTAHH